MPFTDLVFVDKVGELGEEVSPRAVVFVVVAKECQDVVVRPLHVVQV